MKIYNVLTLNKQDKLLEKQPLYLEEKFSFSASFFQSFWFLYYKMWLPTITILFIHICLLILLKNGYTSDLMFIELELVLFVFIGFFANSWRINNLEHKDYQITCVIVANNQDEARLRFYQQYLGTIDVR